MAGRTFIDVRLYVTVNDSTAEFFGVPNPTPNEVMTHIKMNTEGPLKVATIEGFRISDYGIEGEHATYSATKPREERYQGNG